MNRQKLALFLLLIGFISSIIYAWYRFPKQREATPQELQRAAATAAAKSAARPAPPGKGAQAPAQVAKPAAETGAGTQVAVAAGESGRVLIELLERGPQGSASARRDIFSPVLREPVKLPPFKPLPPLPRPIKGPAPPPPPVAVAPPPQAAPPPAPPEDRDEREARKLNFLGFLKKNGEKTVFLGYNEQILLARKGATIANLFLVKDITDEAITLRTNGGSEVVIPLAEKGPRQPSSRTR